MSMKSRRKGATAEREVAAILADHLGVPVVRNLEQTRDGGHDLLGLPFAIEVKRKASGYLSAWWDQTIEQAGDRLPVLVYRFDRQPWLMEVRACDLMPSLTHAHYRATMPLVPDGVAVLREWLGQGEGAGDG